jgi:hypothetical protein
MGGARLEVVVVVVGAGRRRGRRRRKRTRERRGRGDDKPLRGNRNIGSRQKRVGKGKDVKSDWVRSN